MLLPLMQKRKLVNFIVKFNLKLMRKGKQEVLLVVRDWNAEARNVKEEMSRRKTQLVCRP